MITDQPALPRGSAVVGVALKPGQLPAAGLNPGDTVMVVILLTWGIFTAIHHGAHLPPLPVPANLHFSNESAGFLKHRTQANWKFIIDNETDGYHPTFVHASIFSTAKSGIGALYNNESTAVARYLGGAIRPWLERMGFTVAIHPNPAPGFGPILSAERIEGAGPTTWAPRA